MPDIRGTLIRAKSHSSIFQCINYAAMPIFYWPAIRQSVPTKEGLMRPITQQSWGFPASLDGIDLLNSYVMCICVPY